jgi:drug/metabolite transporter (DMT)-like permease
VSFAIFNSYPLMILLIAGLTGLTKGLWHNSYILVFVGLALFIYGNNQTQPTDKREPEKTDFNYGLAMILLAALTEAFIYFLIRRIPTSNHWNHVFIAYFLGAVLISGKMFLNEETKGINDIRVFLSMVINGIIGSVGYFLRFFASYRLEPEVYAPLSYFGVVMSYVYGILFNNEKLNISKVLGTVSILASNYFAPKV